jgi:hypothetical protein
MSNKGRGTVQPESFAVRTHRRDIDGLRGLAVAGVVAYHFGLGVPGGYGGVDVFFVISGFLIAGIIKSELEAGTFSIPNFYVRRIRRILPALTVCLLASTIAATLFLFPYDFKKYGQSLQAAVLSVSNFYFMRMKGYFDSEATEKPLLHTWSLGVEEQFYIVFPLLLLLLFRYARKRVLPVLWLVAIASFAYSCYGVAKDADQAFFSTAGRAWELGIGALLAFGALPKLRARGLLEAEAAIGALLIAFCFLAYTDATRFPGLAALPLCLGAALAQKKRSHSCERHNAEVFDAILHHSAAPQRQAGHTHRVLVGICERHRAQSRRQCCVPRAWAGGWSGFRSGISVNGREADRARQRGCACRADTSPEVRGCSGSRTPHPLERAIAARVDSSPIPQRQRDDVRDFCTHGDASARSRRLSGQRPLRRARLRLCREQRAALF